MDGEDGSYFIPAGSMGRLCVLAGARQKTLKKINQLLRDICRDRHEGIGKPEPLIGNLSGWWSRRIDEAHRMVYRIENDSVIIGQCRSHYGN